MNKEKYGDPEKFRPERYLDSNGTFIPDHELLYFGSGQRRCPGEYMGRMEQYLVFASVIQSFTFTWPNNREEGPKPGFVPGLNAHPKHFKATVTCRF